MDEEQLFGGKMTWKEEYPIIADEVERLIKYAVNTEYLIYLKKYYKFTEEKEEVLYARLYAIDWEIDYLNCCLGKKYNIEEYFKSEFNNQLSERMKMLIGVSKDVMERRISEDQERNR